DKQAFAYSDDISAAALTEAARVVRAIGRQGQSAVAPIERRGRAHLLYAAADPVTSLAEREKVALLERLETLARTADPRVTQVMASLAGEHETVLVARSDGMLVADVRPLVRLSLTVIVEEGGRREQGHAGGGGRFDYAYFDEAILARYAREAVAQAVLNLAARPAPAGTMTVVLGPGWPGILLHEAIGHGLEGDFNRKGTSAFSGRIGQKVAAKGVTVVDDGTLAARRGSLNVDDEGNPTQRTVLIDDGVLQGYLQDRLNARLMQTVSTGNGRRESFAHLPMPRMTNTVMQAGAHDPAEIIASVKSGLYAANFGGGQVDITSGKFVFSTAEAWIIADGKLSHPVRGATLIGNGPDVLTRVSMVGDDLALDAGVGTCGKDGQSVPVGVGQPTLRIDGLTVGGSAG
ncbi:MAG: metalloprotease TldD, partial [Burkholderiales bacterium]|nr:metalloprotease TldD [Burkholderiales bacterium]